MLFFLKNDTITEILNLKNYFYFPLCGVSLITIRTTDRFTKQKSVRTLFLRTFLIKLTYTVNNFIRE